MFISGNILFCADSLCALTVIAWYWDCLLLINGLANTNHYQTADVLGVNSSASSSEGVKSHLLPKQKIRENKSEGKTKLKKDFFP